MFSTTIPSGDRPEPNAHQSTGAIRKTETRGRPERLFFAPTRRRSRRQRRRQTARAIETRPPDIETGDCGEAAEHPGTAGEPSPGRPNPAPTGPCSDDPGDNPTGDA